MNIAHNIEQAFGYVGFKDFVNEDYEMNANPRKTYRELVVFVPEQRLGHSEIHFYRKVSFWNSRPETYTGVARSFGEYVLLIANGHVYVLAGGQIVLDEKI